MGTADEAFSQIRTVQSFVREDEETRRYSGAAGRRGGSRGASARSMRALLFGVVGFVAFAGVVAVLWQGGRLVLDGALTPARSCRSSSTRSPSPRPSARSRRCSAATRKRWARRSACSTCSQLQPTVAEPDGRDAARASRCAARSRCEHVGFRYAPELPLMLDDVTFDIAPGEVVALVGPSGAGKTTVASLIPRFWDVTERPHHARRRRRARAVVRRPARRDRHRAAGAGAVQRLGAREHRLRARPTRATTDVLAAARAAHAMEFIERLPDGLDTLVGERGVKLSGGQRQRIAIARVFLKDPAVVVLDEATSSLDNESERLVEEAMEELLRAAAR